MENTSEDIFLHTLIWCDHVEILFWYIIFTVLMKIEDITCVKTIVYWMSKVKWCFLCFIPLFNFYIHFAYNSKLLKIQITTISTHILLLPKHWKLYLIFCCIPNCFYFCRYWCCYPLTNIWDVCHLILSLVAWFCFSHCFLKNSVS